MLKYSQYIFFFCLSFQWAAAQPNPRFRVVGYLNSWDSFTANASRIELTKITHLNIAFAQPDVMGNLKVIQGLGEVVKQAHDRQVKVLISVGGANLNGAGKYWKDLTSPSHVGPFADKILRYLVQNNLDGIDIDLEGNIIGTNYGNFIKTLSDKIKPTGRLVTAAVATWFEEQVPASCFPYFDFVNIMSFDSTGPWKPSHPGQHSSYSMAVRDLKFWKDKGLPREKMGLGLPFYGYGFHQKASVDEVAYKDIINRYPGAGDKDEVGQVIYYNGMKTIKEKTALALSQAGGVMIWQLSSDAGGSQSLLNAIDQEIRSH